MNRHYDRYLVKKYQPLYADRYQPMTHTAMCWGFEVGDGWFNIINNLSYLLCYEWLSTKKDYERIAGRIGELKYPSLKADDYNPIITEDMILSAYNVMEEEAKKVPVATQVKEKYGTLRFYINGGTDKQYALIDFAEMMSGTTCEVCGKPGKQSKGGWVVTRCKEHMFD